MVYNAAIMAELSRIRACMLPLGVLERWMAGGQLHVYTAGREHAEGEARDWVGKGGHDHESLAK